MEHIHGLDVSWMTHGNPKDKAARNAATRPRSLSNSGHDAPAPSPDANPPALPAPNGGNQTEQGKQTALGRSNSARSTSDERKPPATPSPQRRNSWFSNISSKFTSGGGAAHQSPPQANTASPKPAEFSVPKAAPAKNAVLQHGSRPEGEGPYTPAPPRSSPTGLLQVLRRLSSSNGALSPNTKTHNHGLVERRVLNVDRHRERCAITGLSQAKLRRVAFCVDVEIAPMPKYVDELEDKKGSVKANRDHKKKLKERGEGEALKHPKAVEAQKEVDGEVKATGEALPKEPPKEGLEPSTAGPRPSIDSTTEKTTSTDKKKEKKKKSEEERKARKEKRRKQAEANGTVPMELHYDDDSDSSSTGTIPSITPTTITTTITTKKTQTQTTPTTNPVRIYRRCCQLRETPILRKITEQLTDPANHRAAAAADDDHHHHHHQPGVVVVEKLDLSGYWMQLPDLITLGDYLAVVPVREVVLEGCGLTDEGVRVILAGLLAARKGPVTAARRRKSGSGSGGGGVDGLTEQGGVVERLVLRNNKIGPEGWRHVCLFVYLCRTLKSLDLSGMQFPRQTAAAAASLRPGSPTPVGKQQQQSQGLCHLLAKSLGGRLGGSTLSLLSLGQTGLSTEQLGVVIDGVIKCGVKRLGLANNGIDAAGLGHVARFLKSGLCEGLDLGGNDLRDDLATLADALTGEDCPLWALSLADCNLTPSALCKLLPTLVKLGQFRFVDLSHNQELFSSNPSAVSMLRRYLPKMPCLKRIHLADCAMTPEQAIALAEILPEVTGLAHISFTENPQLVELATNAKTDETQEEACALFASLLAAARVSTSLVAVDIEVPSEQSSDLVKALAKQVVAYCLRNMELAAVRAAEAQDEMLAQPEEPEYPDVLQRLVGHDVMVSTDIDADVDAAPDEDYVIGGTGVVRALACCLKNRGDESRRQSGEFIRDVENGVAQPPRAIPSGGKAKETSKHLLLSARKIRLRLQPAIDKARATANDTQTYHRLMFLSSTLNGIIKRFEDEFPDTRVSGVSADSAIDLPKDDDDEKPIPMIHLDPTNPADADAAAAATAGAISDDEPPTAIRSPILSRSNSQLSLSSRALAHEEARILRAGHKFRAGVVATDPDLRSEHYALLTSGVEMVGADPNHARLLHELLEELGDEALGREVAEKGAVRVFKERREEILGRMRAADPVHWDRFVESQEMARANVKLEGVLAARRGAAAAVNGAGGEGGLVEEAVED